MTAAGPLPPGRVAELAATWHDESDRLATWGTLDPPTACMCRECVLGEATTVGDER